MNIYTKNMFKLKFRISFVKKKKMVFVRGWWLDWFQHVISLNWSEGHPMSMYSNSDFQEF